MEETKLMFWIELAACRSVWLVPAYRREKDDGMYAKKSTLTGWGGTQGKVKSILLGNDDEYRLDKSFKDPEYYRFVLLHPDQ